MVGPVSTTKARLSQRSGDGTRTGVHRPVSAIRSAVASSSISVRCQDGTRRFSGRSARCTPSGSASIGAVGTRTSAASPAPGPAAGAGLGGGTVSGTDGAVGASASCGEVAGPGSEPVSSASRRGGVGGPGGESPEGEMWQASHSISLSSRASGGGPTAPRTSRSRSIVIDGPGQVGHDAVGEGAAVLGVGVPAQVHGVEELVGGERPGRGAFEEAADEVLALVGEGPEVLADDRRQLRLVR